MGIVYSALQRLDRTGIEPVAWQAPTPPRVDAATYPAFETAERWRMPGAKGPEDVAVDHDGRLVTGTDDGRLWRFGEPGRPTVLADTGGRPLGVEVLDDGRYLVCDAERGVLRVDERGRVEVLADSAAGRPLVACNNSAVGRDGTVYFTDSSARFSVAEHRHDLLEHRGTGRLIRLDPVTGRTDLLADGLQFANGVGLAADESFVVVAETGGYRIQPGRADRTERRSRQHLGGEPARHPGQRRLADRRRNLLGRAVQPADAAAGPDGPAPGATAARGEPARLGAAGAAAAGLGARPRRQRHDRAQPARREGQLFAGHWRAGDGRLALPGQPDRARGRPRSSPPAARVTRWSP
jgi:hypothetical protein